MKWIKDQATGEHQLKLQDGFYAVVPTAVGDWYAGFQNYGDVCLDNDIEYFDSWQSARKWCEDKFKGEIMKDNRGELIDILVGVLAGLLMFGIPAVVYVLRTGGVS